MRSQRRYSAELEGLPGTGTSGLKSSSEELRAAKGATPGRQTPQSAMPSLRAQALASSTSSAEKSSKTQVVFLRTGTLLQRAVLRWPSEELGIVTSKHTDLSRTTSAAEEASAVSSPSYAFNPTTMQSIESRTAIQKKSSATRSFSKPNSRNIGMSFLPSPTLPAPQASGSDRNSLEGSQCQTTSTPCTQSSQGPMTAIIDSTSAEFASRRTTSPKDLNFLPPTASLQDAGTSMSKNAILDRSAQFLRHTGNLPSTPSHSKAGRIPAVLRQTGSPPVTPAHEKNVSPVPFDETASSSGENAPTLPANRAQAVRTPTAEFRSTSRAVDSVSMRSKEDVANIVQLMYLSPALSMLSKEALLALAGSFATTYYADGSALFVEGEASDSFVFVLAGMADMHYKGRRVGELRPGACFGELGILFDQTRCCSVRACQEGVLAAILTRDEYIELELQRYHLTGFLRRLKNRIDFLGSVGVFTGLAAADLLNLCHVAQEANFAPGGLLYSFKSDYFEASRTSDLQMREGIPADKKLRVIVNGCCDVWALGQRVSQMSRGGVFGAVATSEAVERVTASQTTQVDVLSIRIRDLLTHVSLKAIARLLEGRALEDTFLRSRVQRVNTSEKSVASFVKGTWSGSGRSLKHLSLAMTGVRRVDNDVGNVALVSQGKCDEHERTRVESPMIFHDVKPQVALPPRSCSAWNHGVV